jgi:general secretion pathway protein L
MHKIAVVDVNEGYCSYAIFSESLKGNSLLGTGLINGNISEIGSKAATSLKGEIEAVAGVIDQVVLLIPRSTAQITSLDIPANSIETLEKMMKFEVSRHFPIPTGQLASAYFITETVSGKYSLNLAGIKQADYEKWFSAASDAGIEPNVVSVSSAAWFKDVAEPDAGAAGTLPEKRVFIEVSPKGFALNLVKGKTIMYSRFSKFPEDVEGSSFFGIAESGSATSASAAVDRISEEAERVNLVSGIPGTEEFFAYTFIAGGGALRKGIARDITLKPQFQNSKIVKLPDNDAVDGFDYIAKANGFGGLRDETLRFNFIPREKRKSPFADTRRRLLAGAAVIALLLLSWGSIAWGIQWYRLETLNSELDRLKADATKTEEILVRVEEIQSSLESFMKFSKKPAFSLKLLDTLTRSIPVNTHLTDIEVRSGSVVIAGISSNASSLISILEDSPLFKNARMIGAVKAASGNTEKFKIGMELE